ncbi:hypothetical protein OKW76_06195 [Sphingomonas sp. S1-29]|uniref:hypothetical protein n=1 Tax=Sphingomonas sp. S1-29 TaxID=2991074 RepID=UPI00223F037F|nr:hypothetical protein [Sphingomonas sp. S1-29]UZK70619.1 hypothetical protein OKW76_06195 [Sphingomonas sp. S1-29]
MTRFTPIFAAACALAIAAPALAEDPKPATRATAADSQKAVPNPNQRICFRDTLTGSHIPRTECNTRAEWAKQGVKVPAR